MTDAADPELDKIKREQLLSDERKALAEKRLAEEQKAAEVIAAQLKNARDRIGTITKYDGESSSKAEGTEAKAGVGLVDIRRRCAEKIGEIAGEIAKAFGDLPDKPLIFYAGDEKPSTRNHLLFKLQHDAVNGMFDQAATDCQSAQVLDAPAQGTRAFSLTVGTAVTAVSAILEIGAGIASYLKVNYTISGAEVTGFDDGFLAEAVAGKLTGKAVFMPGRWMPDDQAVLDQVTELFKKNAASAANLAHARGRIAALNAELAQTNDDTRKGQIPGIVGAYDKAATALEAAQLSCEAFLQALRTADTQGIPWIALVAQESLVGKKIAEGANLVFLRLHSVTGGCIASESLRDTFSKRVPFRVAGGAVASYLVLDKDGKVLKSGQAQRHSGYENLELG